MHPQCGTSCWLTALWLEAVRVQAAVVRSRGSGSEAFWTGDRLLEVRPQHKLLHASRLIAGPGEKLLEELPDGACVIARRFSFSDRTRQSSIGRGLDRTLCYDISTVRSHLRGMPETVVH
ncbi:hypothetical protein EYF80_046469 [Liparis tanakae]|uniref:Uncharacterized protein n=1 Tax=Liparis tanakae TaxID=230148 RepID=A0A4Z2FRE1_9TELE|nr:hypothetical protein EYF80_046469 [Liparis tanakae]